MVGLTLTQWRVSVQWSYLGRNIDLVLVQSLVLGPRVKRHQKTPTT